MTGIEPLMLLQIAGAGIGAIGAIKSASAQNRQQSATHAATIQASNYNAAVAKENAAMARKQAAADAERQDRERRLRAGANVARVGGSGVQLEGSVLDVLEDNALNEELDKLRIIHSGEVQAIGFERDSELSLQTGRNAPKPVRKSGFAGAASSVLRGVTAINSAGGFDRSLGTDALGQPYSQAAWT